MKKGKKAQLQLSFGMIFSIILIVVFIAFAFYAIMKFLDINKSSQIGTFVNDLKEDIESRWKASYGSQEVEYSLPSKIEKVCFSENSELYFRPPGSGGDFDYIEISHLDIAKMTENGDFCIDKTGEKIKMVIKKNSGDALVTIGVVG